MPNDKIVYIDGFIVYQDYQFFNEVTREPDVDRHVICECPAYNTTEEEMKKYCETYNLENPEEPPYYYELGKVID